MKLSSCVCAVFLAIILAGQDASAQRAFPEIKKVNDVAISFQRGGGMGWGPSYRILISGNGSVKYEGYGGVFTWGQRTARISKVAVDQLIEEFHKAGFFERKITIDRRPPTYQCALSSSSQDQTPKRLWITAYTHPTRKVLGAERHQVFWNLKTGLMKP